MELLHEDAVRKEIEGNITVMYNGFVSPRLIAKPDDKITEPFVLKLGNSKDKIWTRLQRSASGPHQHFDNGFFFLVTAPSYEYLWFVV